MSYVVMLAGMECMGKDCDILVPEDFVLNLVKDSKLRDKYIDNTFSDYVNVSSCMVSFIGLKMLRVR
jgi:hypothetical protein